MVLTAAQIQYNPQSTNMSQIKHQEHIFKMAPLSTINRDTKFIVNLTIDEFEHKDVLCTSLGQRRSTISSQFIEEIATKEGTAEQVKVTYCSERNGITSHIRRDKIHQNHYLDMLEMYTEEEIIKEYGWGQFLIYKRHVDKFGKKFRWGSRQKTFQERETERHPGQIDHVQYLPMDVKIEFHKLEVICTY